MKSSYALLALVLGCEPGPTIHLGSWPHDADAEPGEDAGTSDEEDASDASVENDASDAADEDEEDSAETSAPAPPLPCSRDADCESVEDQAHCEIELGYCVECFADAHCDLGEHCESNVCSEP